MTKLPFVRGETIDRQAYLLLQEHASRAGKSSVTTPVPLDHIIEYHLGLGMEFDDLRPLGEDVLGATFVDETGKGHVVVDESLEHDPRGRLEFTQAHEVGHWVMHRHYIVRATSTQDLFGNLRGAYVVACRDIGIQRKQKARGEIQADRFAGAMLMPSPLVKASWTKLFGSGPRAVGTKKQPVEKWVMMEHPAARDMARQIIDDGQFSNVSVAAMVVRLGQLGYLLGEPPRNQLPF